MNLKLIEMGSRLKGMLNFPLRSRRWKTQMYRIIGGSDIQRWLETENLHENWNSRTQFMATLIPDGSTVLEFGAGRGVLGAALASNCKYIPSDIVARRDDYLVIDLNSKDWPPIPEHSFSVFSGVLEYVHDLSQLFARLSESSRFIICTYVFCESQTRAARAVRRGHGWVTDWSSTEFLSLVEQSGFTLKDEYDWRAEGADYDHKVMLLENRSFANSPPSGKNVAE